MTGREIKIEMLKRNLRLYQLHILVSERHPITYSALSNCINGRYPMQEEVLKVIKAVFDEVPEVPVDTEAR